MAHLKKWSKAEAIKILAHNRRDAEAKGYYRENIDNERSHLNYSLFDGSDDFVKRLEERGVKVYAANSTKRKPPNYCVSVLITAPQEIKDNPEREREFFEHCVKFLQERYGAENTVSALVHKDETTPHLHYLFTPVIQDKKDNTKLKLCAKDVINRQELSVFHKDLQVYIDQKMDMHVSILTDDAPSKTNLSINALKLQSILDAQEKILKEKALTEEDLRNLVSICNDTKLMIQDTKSVVNNCDYFDERYFNKIEAKISLAEALNPFVKAEKYYSCNFTEHDFRLFKKHLKVLRNNTEYLIPIKKELDDTVKRAEEAEKATEEEKKKVIKLDADLSSEKKKVEALRDDVSRLKADIGKLNENLAKEKDTNNNLIYHLSLYRNAPKADLILQKEAAVYTFSCYLSALTAQLLAFRHENSDIVSDSMIWEDVGTTLYSNPYLNSNKVSELIYNAYLCQLDGQEPSPTDEYREYWSLPYPSTVNLLEEIPPDVFSPSFYMDKDGNSLVDEEFLKRAEVLRQSLILLKGKSKDVPKEHEAEHSDNFER